MTGELPAPDYSGAANLEVMAEAVNYNRFLLDLLRRDAPPRGRILDFGAGTGTFALPLAAEGRVVACVEPDPGLRARLAAGGLEAHGDLAEFGGTRFDFIYSLNVLEHIEDDGAALAGIARSLAPGGRLLVYVPAFQILFSAMDRRVGHLRRYRRGGLVRLAEAAGLSVEEARYVDSLGFFATLAYKAMSGGATGGGSGDIDRGALRLYDRMALGPSLALDRLTGRLLGKNVLLRARKS